jgi:hypothetical protein
MASDTDWIDNRVTVGLSGGVARLIRCVLSAPCFGPTLTGGAFSLLDALELEAQVARHLVLIADELAAVHDAGLSGTFEQEFGANYQDLHPASLIGMRHRVGDSTARGTLLSPL